MKKILTLLFCIVAVCAIGQTTIPNSKYAYQTINDALSTIKANGYRIVISDPLAGGNFILRDTADGFKADGGMNIAYAGTSKVLSRMTNERHRVYISHFGAKEDSTFNSTFAYEAAVAYLKKLGGGCIVIDGKYWLDSLKIYNRISVVGTAVGSSILVARKRTMNIGRPTGFIVLDKGPVVLANISDISIYANNRVGGSDTAINRGQWGVYIQSQFDATNSNGGYWNSVWTNVSVLGFDNGEWFRAGYSSHHSSLPIQHIDFYNIDVEVRGGVGVRHTGQHGQIKYSNGKVKGIKNTVGSKATIDMEITFDPNPAEVANNGIKGENTADTAGVGKAARIPGSITWENGFNCANSEIANWWEGGSLLNYTGAWAENAAIGWHIGKHRPSGIIQVSRPSNAGVSSNYIDTTHTEDNVYDSTYTDNGDGDSTSKLGTIFQWAGGDADITWGAANLLAGNADQFLQFTDGMTVNKMGTLNFLTPFTRTTTTAGFFPNSGPAQVALDSAHKVGVGNLKNMFILKQGTNPAGLMDSVTGWTAPDQVISLTVLVSSITVTSNGNILTPGSRSYTFGQNNTILLQRSIGSAYQWKLVNYPYATESASPTDSSFYAQGTRIVNRLGGVGQVSGWECISGGYAVTDSIFALYGTTPRAKFRPVNTTINGVPGTEQTFSIFNSTNPNLVLGIVDNVPLQSHTINIPMADSTKAGFLSIAGQYIQGGKVFMAPPTFLGLANSIAGDSVLVIKSTNHNPGRAAITATLPLSINATAGNINIKTDTGRATTQVATGYDLNKVRDSLQANISAANSVRAIPYFITVGNGALTAGTSNYAMSGAGSFSTDSLQRNNAFPVAGTIGNLVVVTGGTQDASGALTFTFKSGSTAIGATNSSVIATVAASAGAGKYTDLTHTLHVASLDQVFIAIKNNAAATSATIRSISFTFTPD